jgi:hypothetical protein
MTAVVVVAFRCVEPSSVIRLPVAHRPEQTREHAWQATVVHPPRREALSFLDREVRDAIFLFVSLFVIDAVAIWGALWLGSQSFMGGTF